MEPVEREEIIIKKYWDCGNNKHRHKTYEVALECMVKSSGPKHENRWNDESRHALLIRNRAGEKQAALAKEFNVTPSAIRAVIEKAKRHEIWLQWKEKNNK